MGGSEAGNGIKDVLYGDYNPSGRLPYTIARNDGDYPAHRVLDPWTPNYPVVIPYTEGCVPVAGVRRALFFAHEMVKFRLLIDYRWFDAVCWRFCCPRAVTGTNFSD